MDIDLAVIPTNLRGRDGKPVMASPRDVLVLGPRRTARILSADDKGHLRIRRALRGRYVVYMADVEKLSASASSVVEGQDVVFTATTQKFPTGPLSSIRCVKKTMILLGLAARIGPDDHRPRQSGDVPLVVQAAPSALAW